MIGQTLRVLKRATEVKFVVTYADPVHGHLGVIYQASNWVYIGLSEATPMFDPGDGVPRNSRSIAYTFGTHRMEFLAERGVNLKKIRQRPKHRYFYFLDRRWRDRLAKRILPYPKREAEVLDAGA